MEPESAEIDLSIASSVSPTLLTETQLASLVDQHLAALWRGDEASDNPFFAWLASCWRPEPATEPARGRRARSVLAAGGLGITWIESPSAIMGFIQGHREGHYRVSPYSAPPSAAGEASAGERSRRTLR